MLNKQFSALELDHLAADPNSLIYLDISSRLFSKRNDVLANAGLQEYQQRYFKQEQNVAAMRQLFGYTNDLTLNLSNMDPRCVDQLGGWQQLLPVMLNSMSTMSAMSGPEWGLLAGAATRIVSSVSILMKDIKAKTALKNLITTRNNRVLACMYYAAQNTACSTDAGLPEPQ